MTIKLTSSAISPTTPLMHFWNLCVGAGRANEGLRASWLDQMELATVECGFRYVRFHGLFHDDMFVYTENEKGEAIYNFQYIDDLFDRLLDLGVRPFVEFGFSPLAIASKVATVFWWKGNGAPPSDYDKWVNLIDKVVTHWVERYGIDEVREWYFEVWNEPNLTPFFTGTKSQYFELYRVTALAVKAIDSQLRVGGPSTSNFVPDARFDGETEDVSAHLATLNAADIDALEWKPVWLADFFDYCEAHSLPVDFISCHPYPTDWALDELGESKKTTRSVAATPTDLKLLRKMVDESPYPDAEIHLTEWSSSPSPRDFTHDYPQAATYIVRANIESIGNVDSLSYWTFTDVFEEGGAGDTVFHGGFGMINYQGIVKPSFHAYRFLNALGDQLLARVDGGVVTRDSATEKLSAVAYHYPPEMPKSVPASFDNRAVADATLALGAPVNIAISLVSTTPDASFLVEVLDKDHGNAMASWQAMGSPEPPNRDQTNELKNAAWSTKKLYVTADAAAELSLELIVEPWSVVLVREL